MPRPTIAAIVFVVLGAIAVFLLVGRSESEAPSGSGGEPGATVSTPSGQQAVEPNGVVEYIVDGDTVDVSIDGETERIRLIGMDTPETKRPDTPIECYGPEASAFVAELLPLGTAVRVERDIVARDDYGRLLGYVYRADDGLFVNAELVLQGFAQPLSIAPNTVYESTFVEAARTAEADDRGLWAAC